MITLHPEWGVASFKGEEYTTQADENAVRAHQAAYAATTAKKWSSFRKFLGTKQLKFRKPPQQPRRLYEYVEESGSAVAGD